MTLTPLDVAFLGQLPITVRQEATAWAEALRAVAKPIQKSLERIAARFGCDYVTARRKYDAFRKSGYNVRVLVNCSKAGITKERLHSDPGTASGTKHPDFVSYIKRLAESYQRNTAAAHRAFCKAWKEGNEIPGLDNALPRHELPPGCGYDNVMRIIRDAFALEATRKGLGSAVAKYGPQVFTTRANLWYGSHYMIDDLWHDNFVIFGSEKSSQIVRVLELDCLEVFSGALPAWGCKPRIRREDGTMDNLKEKYARLIVANILFTEGYSPRGTEFIAEHGTAAISAHVEGVMRKYGGMLPGTDKPVVSVRRSGITGEEQAVIGWWGKGKGNPRVKAALESIRNLKHNELAFLPGQTGKDVDSRPEYTHGQLVEDSEIIKAMAVLAQKNPLRARQMKFNLLNYHSHFLPLLTDIYREINGRDWHRLEGWHAAGNMVVEYRMAPDASHWLSDADFSKLPAVSKQLLLQTASEDKRYVQTRRLSPTEVRQRDRSSLIKFPAFAIAELLGPDFAREVEVKGAYFRPFSDEELSPEPLRYESVVTDGEGREVQLKDDTYLNFINPFDLSVVFVHDAARRYLGFARRAERADMADVEQIKAAHGRRSHRIAELKKPILQRHAETVKAQTKLMEHNARVLDETEPFTADEVAQAEVVHELGADAAADILAPADAQTISERSAADDLLGAISQRDQRGD
jgi:hypothetical protein